MSPLLTFLMAILTPFILTACLLAPIYGGVFGAAYIIYLPAAGAAHPLAGHVTDVFYMLDVYQQLFHYWQANHSSLSFVHYTLPIIGLPALCTLIAFYLTYRIAGGLLNLFRLSASH